MRELQAMQVILHEMLSTLDRSKRLKRVTVAFGEISDLDQKRIVEHWHQFSKGTPAEHAQLHFRLIKAEVQCMACFSKYNPVNGEIHCPHCGSYGAKVLSGEEFYLESFELDDE